MLDSWRSARIGSPATVLLRGEAGAGKSRLVRRLADHAEAEGAFVLAGASIDVGDQLPFWPLISALRGLLAPASSGGETARDRARPDGGRAAGAPRPGAGAGRGTRCAGAGADPPGADHRSPTRPRCCSPSRTCTGRTAGPATPSSPSPRTCTTSRCSSCSPCAPRRSRPGTRCRRWSPSSDATRARACATSARSTAPPSPAWSPRRPGDDPELVDRVWQRSRRERVHRRRDAARDRRGRARARSRGPCATWCSAASPCSARRPAPSCRRWPSGRSRCRTGCSPTSSRLAEPALVAALRDTVTAALVVVDTATEGYTLRHGLIREVITDELMPGERRELHRRYALALDRLLDVLPADPVAIDGARTVDVRTDLVLRRAHHWYAADDVASALHAVAAAARVTERLHDYGGAHRQWTRVLELADRRALPTGPIRRALAAVGAPERDGAGRDDARRRRAGPARRRRRPRAGGPGGADQPGGRGRAPRGGARAGRRTAREPRAPLRPHAGDAAGALPARRGPSRRRRPGARRRGRARGRGHARRAGGGRLRVSRSRGPASWRRCTRCAPTRCSPTATCARPRSRRNGR